MKKIAFVLSVLTLTLLLSVTAFAATYDTPAEACAGITGKTLEEVVAQRLEGATYGSIAIDAGKLEEFKAAMLELKEDRLDQLVTDGTISQADADEILDLIQERQALCDGTGAGQGGCGLGLGLGMGRGQGVGQGAGRGAGRGQGLGLRDGSCLIAGN